MWGHTSHRKYSWSFGANHFRAGDIFTNGFQCERANLSHERKHHERKNETKNLPRKETKNNIKFMHIFQYQRDVCNVACTSYVSK